MTVKGVSFSILGLLIGFVLLAQEKASYFVDDDGRLYWNKSLPIYINIAPDSLSKGVALKSQNQSKYSHPLYLDTEGINWIRTRYAVDPETRQTVTPNVEVKFEIYADGLAPRSTIQFNNAETHSSSGNKYYGKGLTVNLLSGDSGSGVKSIKYRVNGGEPSVYADEFAVENEGEFTIDYWATDLVGNQEEEKRNSIIVDITPPTTFHNINGISDDNIISLASKIYFTLEDNLSGVRNTYYRIDEGPKITYNGRQIPLGNLSDGDHTIYYHSIDNVLNEESEKSVSFYLDKTAPLTAADVLGDRFIVDGQVYFSGRSKLKLTAIDNKSGVKEIRYSVDGEDFKVYNQPFYLPAVAGTHSVRYYSIDNAANKSSSESGYESFKHNVSKVYVDLTGPNLNYQLSGQSSAIGDTVYIGPQTKINLTGTDQESGMDYISYSLDGNQEETKYDSSFSVSESGYHQLDIFGYDNVKNRNIATRYFFVDNKPPELFERFSINPIGEKKGLKVYPANLSLFLSATDDLIGLDKITYQFKGQGEKQYTGMITGLKARTKFMITIKAYDVLGNRAEKTVEFYTSK